MRRRPPNRNRRTLNRNRRTLNRNRRPSNPRPSRRRRRQEEEEQEAQEAQEKVHRLLSFFSLLDSRERDIIRLRFGLDGKRSKTLAEVGELFHLSGERIRQIQNQALVKLRDMVRENEEGEDETEESD